MKKHNQTARNETAKMKVVVKKDDLYKVKSTSKNAGIKKKLEGFRQSQRLNQSTNFTQQRFSMEHRIRRDNRSPIVGGSSEYSSLVRN